MTTSRVRKLACIALLFGGPAMLAAQQAPKPTPKSAPKPAAARNAHDSAYAAMQMRGLDAMGVDQYSSTHHFDALPTGGRIVLERDDAKDAPGISQIRTHLHEIARAFSAGDFSTPAFVHMQQVPGTKVMAAKRAKIRYTVKNLPRGGELELRTTDRAALDAIHEFMAFQRGEHHAGGMTMGGGPPHQRTP